MNFLTRTLGPAVLLVCALSPALVAATSAVPKQPASTSRAPWLDFTVPSNGHRPRASRPSAGRC